jgi:hypothetical protein
MVRDRRSVAAGAHKCPAAAALRRHDAVCEEAYRRQHEPVGADRNPSVAADEGLAEDVGFRLQFVQAVLHHVTDADDALQSTLLHDR